jgi:chromodomain-helicase-DNA-binding protein 7
LFRTFTCRNDDETNSKHGDDDEEVRSTKDEDRPSSSGEEKMKLPEMQLLITTSTGLDDEESSTNHPSEIDPNLIWPTMQDLNTRLRRVITSYQRNYKKEELKQQQKAKVGFKIAQVSSSTIIISLWVFGRTFKLFLESL